MFLDKYFPIQTKEEQIAAVTTDPASIKYIDNPSEEVQLAAIQQNVHAIGFINNPTEVVINFCNPK